MTLSREKIIAMDIQGMIERATSHMGPTSKDLWMKRYNDVFGMSPEDALKLKREYDSARP